MAKSKNIKTPESATTSVKTSKTIKKPNKQRVKGSSETDNPKYANKDFMLELIDKAAAKETKREGDKLAKKLKVEKLVEEKESKKKEKSSLKQKKLDEAKQRYLEAQRKKKNKKTKTKAKLTEASKKKVRFA